MAVYSTSYSTNADDFQDVPGAVGVMEKAYADGHCVPVHSHARGQLVYATSGVIRATVDGTGWVVPQGRALWVPARMRHALDMVGTVILCTLYIRADAAQALGPVCRTIAVSALLRELIGVARAAPAGYPAHSRADLIARLILLELERPDQNAVQLPMPRDPRLLRLCTSLLRQPGQGQTLDQWAACVGASPRTLARLFRAETGLGFVAWRQQVRLADAVCQLDQGRSVKQIALDLGYAHPSAFVAMFRTALGHAPLTYLALQRARVKH